MQKFFQIVGFLAGVLVFGVGIYALFKGVGSSSGGSFKMDDIIEFKGDSTAIIFALAGVFLMVAAAGWFRNKKKADVERSKKLAVAQDLKKYIQASEPLTKFTGAQEITPLNQELRRALTDYPPALSAESQAVLRELSLQVHLIGSPEASPQKLSLSPEKIAVEVHKAPETKTRGQKFCEFVKDIGPVLIGIASVVIAAFVGYYTDRVTTLQAESQKLAAESQQNAAATAQADFRARVVAELGEKDETKKALVAIKLAQYGEQGLPAVMIALGDREPIVRDNAAGVIGKMLQSGEPELQNRLFQQILETLRTTRNPYLRTGALRSFVKVVRQLPGDKTGQVLRLLQERIGSQAELCAAKARSEDMIEDELVEAALFLGNVYSMESEKLLEGILQNCSEFGRAKAFAKSSLENVKKKLSPQKVGSVRGAKPNGG